jgi:hypothetical protein
MVVAGLDHHSIENADHCWTDYELMNKLPDLELGCNQNCIKVHQCVYVGAQQMQ